MNKETAQQVNETNIEMQNKKETFVYLLGAGASCNALPVVSNFIDRLKSSAERINERARFLDTKKLPSGKEPKQVLEDFGKDLSWLATEGSKHISIDTYAKKLYISQNRSDLDRLKTTLSCYLWLEQVLRPTDMRYDAFVAALVEREDDKISLPGNVKVITWNYDSQIERAFYPYYKGKKVYDALQVFPRIVARNMGLGEGDIDVNMDLFCVVRLNGNAELHWTDDGKITRSQHLYYLNTQEDAMQSLVEMYDSYVNIPYLESRYPFLNFAWEENEDCTKCRAIAKKVASVTTSLVTIGYSFPFFNRRIDREILGAMNNLQTIFVQVPKEDFSAIRERILSAKPDINNIVHIDDLKQFFIPHNL